MYAASDTGELMGKKAVMGALTLYLDFINLFIMLLRLFGQRRQTFYFLRFFQFVFLNKISKSKEFFKTLPLESVTKYFKFLLLGLKFLQILYKAFSAAFLKTLKLTYLLEMFKP